MRLRKLLREVREVTIVHPGDALMFHVDRPITAKQAHEMRRLLDERLARLDVVSLVVYGIESIDVLRNEVTP